MSARLSSRSDVAKVAVGFSPWIAALLAVHRVAMPESFKSIQPSLRDEDLYRAMDRGLKATATIAKSLRDCGRVF